MKKQQNLKQLKQNFYKFLFVFLFMQICTPGGASDLLDRAASLEREDKNEEARGLYLEWLSKSESSESDSFGRILIHTLRIPAALKDDLGLINKHVHRVKSIQDKKDILKTALILAQLSGNQQLSLQYQRALSILSEDDDEALFPITMTSDDKYKYMTSLKENAGSENLLIWIDRIHTQAPSLLNESDWLFLLQDILSKADYKPQAEIYKKLLLKDFSNSIEASLLRGEVSLLRGPDDLISESETADLAVEKPSPPENVSFFQAGAFQDYKNALQLRSQLQETGLISSLIKEGSVYKVLVESHDDDHTLQLLKDMGIKAFRIQP